MTIIYKALFLPVGALIGIVFIACCIGSVIEASILQTRLVLKHGGVQFRKLTMPFYLWPGILNMLW